MTRRSVFVTGTGTGVGKTVVSAWLALHWKADYWKPIQSGLDESTDTESIGSLCGQTCHPEAYRLTQPLSPHESARRDGVEISLERMQQPQASKLVIEGAGGLMVPLNEKQHMGHLIARLQAPVIIVANSGLGTINHTWLTAMALLQFKLPCLGVLMVGDSNPGNRLAIEHYTGLPVLAELPVFSPLDKSSLLTVPMPVALTAALDSELTLR